MLARGHSLLVPPQFDKRQERSAGSTLPSPKYGTQPVAEELRGVQIVPTYHYQVSIVIIFTILVNSHTVRARAWPAVLCASNGLTLPRSVIAPACPCNSTNGARMHMLLLAFTVDKLGDFVLM